MVIVIGEWFFEVEQRSRKVLSGLFAVVSCWKVGRNAVELSRLAGRAGFVVCVADRASGCALRVLSLRL